MKYLSTHASDCNDGRLKQIIAGRKDFVIWRLVDPKTMLIRASSTTRDSCNVAANDSSEERKEIPLMTSNGR